MNHLKKGVTYLAHGLNCAFVVPFIGSNVTHYISEA